jgi:hypothetical protein
LISCDNDIALVSCDSWIIITRYQC